MQMHAKSGQLKNESKSDVFSAPDDAQECANGTTINVCEVCLIIQFRVHQIMQLESHLKMHFKIYIKMHKRALQRMH